MRDDNQSLYFALLAVAIGGAIWMTVMHYRMVDMFDALAVAESRIEEMNQQIRTLQTQFQGKGRLYDLRSMAGTRSEWITDRNGGVSRTIETKKTEPSPSGTPR